MSVFLNVGLQLKIIFIVNYSLDSFLHRSIGCPIYKMLENGVSQNAS